MKMELYFMASAEIAAQQQMRGIKDQVIMSQTNANMNGVWGQ